MIIFRYLSREILTSMLAVSSVLLVIIMSGRFIKYLAKAATGELSPELLLQIMAFRLPGFLELILPLGLFLGILLGYGRLYLDSEMAVLYASGLSQRRLIGYALGPALLVAGAVAALSLYLTPAGAHTIGQLMQQQEARSTLELVTPGRFQVGDDGRVIYTEAVTERGGLDTVFIAQRSKQAGELVVVLAEQGERTGEIDGQRYLLLQDGRRYEGQPGRADYSDTRFQEYGLRLKQAEAIDEPTDIESMATVDLLGRTDAEGLAQLHWRLTLPVLALVVTLIAVPMARVNPRQGRYARLVPSILIYLLYLTLLSAARSEIEEGGAVWLLWLVHLLFLLLAANLVLLGGFWSRQFNRLPTFSWRTLRRKPS
ncbi:LPS export ABC transporter permease LptF [Marinobacterium arenosum]|uniref:LPS export ABC transporter permease LptF n=1 Tax=Marinobacterium arenosum TaxID=2862496 RepID=UPI001C955238|nr:LPS export ABC transporter permease LptF [Marinobacterium arenosum]MBY4678984.1 LPS export ABC transporter permease LptF [Marinobacterium arenosum]